MSNGNGNSNRSGQVMTFKNWNKGDREGMAFKVYGWPGPQRMALKGVKWAVGVLHSFLVLKI